MFDWFSDSPEEEALNKAILAAFSTLAGLDEASPEYSATTDQLVKLLKLKKEINPSWRPSPDAVLGVAGTILTAIIVLNYEKLGVVTSKAFGFVGKLMK